MNRKFYTGGINQFGFGTFNSGVQYVPMSKKGNNPNVSPLSGGSPNLPGGMPGNGGPGGFPNGPGSLGGAPNGPGSLGGSPNGPGSSGSPNFGLNFPGSGRSPSGGLGLPGKNGNNPNVGLNFPGSGGSPSGNLGFPNRSNQPGPGVGMGGGPYGGNGGFGPNNNGYPYGGGNPFGNNGNGPYGRNGMGNNPNFPFNNPLGNSGNPNNRYDPFNPNRPPGSMTPNPMRSKSYLTPEILKMQQLENQLSKMGDPNNPNIGGMERGGGPRDMMSNPYAYTNRPYMNNTGYGQGRTGMGGMDDPYNGLPPFLADRENRRNQIKAELKRARDIVNNDSDESETDSGDEEDDRYSKVKSRAPRGSVRGSVKGSVISPTAAKSVKRDSIINPSTLGASPAKRVSVAGAEILNNLPSGSQKGENNNNLSNPEINRTLTRPEEAKAEAQEFMNSLPSHVALRLQGDNFKARENMNELKSNFKDIQNELEGQLEEMEMQQKMNFEAIKNALENAGKLDTEEPEESLNALPKLIDEKIKERERLRGKLRQNQINEENKIDTEQSLPTESSQIVIQANNNQQQPPPNQFQYGNMDCCGGCGGCGGMHCCQGCCNFGNCPNCGGCQDVCINCGNPINDEYACQNYGARKTKENSKISQGLPKNPLTRKPSLKEVQSTPKNSRRPSFADDNNSIVQRPPPFGLDGGSGGTFPYQMNPNINQMNPSYNQMMYMQQLQQGMPGYNNMMQSSQVPVQNSKQNPLSSSLQKTNKKKDKDKKKKIK